MTLNGYAGNILRVNLTTGTCSAEAEDAAMVRKWLGGPSLGAKILWEEVPANVAWSDPANRLMFLAGPLTGTKAKGSSTISIVTKGPMTNGATSTQANGYFAAFMRFAGFDHIVVEGKSNHLCYLYLRDGKAELRDARHLAGRDSWETQDLIKQELGFTAPAMSVLCIGPAGENLVRFAGVFCDYGHSASHNGPGAVMGSKNLKAIAIARSSWRVPVFDDARLGEAANQLFEIVKTDPQYSMLYRWGTLHLFEMATPAGRIPVHNYQTNIAPITREQAETFTKEYLREHLEVLRPHPCWACQMHHSAIIKIPEGPLAGAPGDEPEFEGFTGMGSQIGVWNGLTAAALSNECDRLGMDLNETSWTLGLAMECYQKGLLTKERTDGIDLTFGNLEAIRQVMRKIALRDGFGNLLAEGAMRAARAIGGDAPNFAVHTMSGNTPIGHDHRPTWTYMFDISVANTGCYELHLSPRASAMGLKDPNPDSPGEVARWVATAKWVAPFFDSLGICRLPNREVPDLWLAMLNAATGWDFTLEEAKQVGYRAINLLRAFNVRHGRGADADAPSPRYGSVPADGPNKGRDVRPVWASMLDIYYRDMGWDKASAKPLPQTLRRLGLQHIVPELWPGEPALR